jgi:hypothetical protein
MRTSRSRVHMLAVAAARLEADHANPKLIADLREAAKEAAGAGADGRGYSEDDDRRIEHQRTLFNTLQDSNAADRLRVAMAQRAYDLMWDGDCLACDALLEFLPSDLATEILDAWESDQDGKTPKTKWHGGAA